MKTKTILAAIAVCIALTGVMSAEDSKQGLHGSWVVKIYPQGTTAPLLAVDLNSFGCDGTMIAPTGSGLPGLPPGVVGDTVGTGTGTYVSTGEGNFRFTFYRIITGAGLITGYQRVSGTITLSASGNETFDRAQADFYDVNWNVLFSATTDAYGTRLQTPMADNFSHCH